MKQQKISTYSNASKHSVIDQFLLTSIIVIEAEVCSAMDV